MRGSSLMYTVMTVSMISFLIELFREIIEMLVVCQVFGDGMLQLNCSMTMNDME